VTADEFALRFWAALDAPALQPVVRFILGLSPSDRAIVFVLLAIATALGFAAGRRSNRRAEKPRYFGGWRFPRFQNSGEALVSRILRAHFAPPDYHLMNHVTLETDDGTTQIDHILVSRFGVFVIETKDYNGWILGKPADATWTKVLFRQKFKFQNPIFQNYRHICAVRILLDFLPPDAIRSLVVFSGNAEFKTPLPPGVIMLDQLPEYLRQQTTLVMSRNRQQFCVGRLETARLAISRETDIEHLHSLARRYNQYP
jgi:hypothetical protein